MVTYCVWCVKCFDLNFALNKFERTSEIDPCHY